jgi:hypothetical protein
MSQSAPPQDPRVARLQQVLPDVWRITGYAMNTGTMLWLRRGLMVMVPGSGPIWVQGRGDPGPLQERLRALEFELGDAEPIRGPAHDAQTMAAAHPQREDPRVPRVRAALKKIGQVVVEERIQHHGRQVEFALESGLNVQVPRHGRVSMSGAGRLGLVFALLRGADQEATGMPMAPPGAAEPAEVDADPRVARVKEALEQLGESVARQGPFSGGRGLMLQLRSGATVMMPQDGPLWVQGGERAPTLQLKLAELEVEDDAPDIEDPLPPLRAALEQLGQTIVSESPYMGGAGTLMRLESHLIVMVPGDDPVWVQGRGDPDALRDQLAAAGITVR